MLNFFFSCYFHHIKGARDIGVERRAREIMTLQQPERGEMEHTIDVFNNGDAATNHLIGRIVLQGLWASVWAPLLTLVPSAAPDVDTLRIAQWQMQLLRLLCELRDGLRVLCRLGSTGSHQAVQPVCCGKRVERAELGALVSECEQRLGVRRPKPRAEGKCGPYPAPVRW